MAVKNTSGHGVTSVVSGTDLAVVIPAPIQFPPAPTQNGGFPSTNA